MKLGGTSQDPVYFCIHRRVTVFSDLYTPALFFLKFSYYVKQQVIRLKKIFSKNVESVSDPQLLLYHNKVKLRSSSAVLVAIATSALALSAATAYLVFLGARCSLG